MNFPSWFQTSIHRRLDELAIEIQSNHDIEWLRTGERSAFKQLELGMNDLQKACFLDWEEKHNYVLSKEKERLYLQGLKDGAQLLNSLVECPEDNPSPSYYNSD